MIPGNNLRNIIFKCFIVLLVVLFSSCITSDLSYAYDLKDKVREFTLENGLKVLIVERHANPTVALYISHETGAIDERDGCTGTAHLLEHLMFKGTETIGTRNFDRENRVLLEIHDVGNTLDTEMMKGKTCRYAKNRVSSQTTRDSSAGGGEMEHPGRNRPSVYGKRRRRS